MVNREDCVNTINKFIKSKTIYDATILLNYLLDIKNPSNREQIIDVTTSNPVLFTIIMDDMLKELMRCLEINRVLDCQNELIMVF